MTEEERIAAEEERLRQIAEGATNEDPPAEEPDPDPEPQEDEPQDPDPENPEPDADPAAAAAAAEEPPATRTPGRAVERRISRLAQEKRDAIADNERLRRALIAQGIDPDNPEAPPVEADPAAAADDPPARPAARTPQRYQFATQEQFNEAVRAEAARQAAAMSFNSRCNAVEDAGAKVGKDRWNAAKTNLGLLDDHGVIPMALLEPALETDHPELVLLALGEDPDLAASLLEMSATRRAIEIAKLDARAKPAAPAPKPRSAAPPPVDPIRGRSVASTATTPTDRDTDDEWLRKRNAQLAAKEGARA